MADWTVNPPIKVKHDVVPSRQGAPLDLRVFVRFQDDAANKFPDESQEAKIYTARGSGAWDAIREAVRRDRLTLQEGEFPPADGETFTPADAPTPTEAAISKAQNARRRLRNLNALQLELEKVDTDTLGTSGITFAQARSALINGNASTDGVVEDITDAARLAVFLENVG